MRYVTPPGAGETLVAAGVYEYFLNGQPAGVREPWTVHRRADGSQITRVERDAAAYGTTILVEAAPSRCEIRLTTAHGPEVHAVYEFAARECSVARVVNGGARPVENVAWPDGAVFYPLMRVFLGAVILRVAARESAPVVVPSIENPTDAENLLRPNVEERRAELVGVEKTARRYRFLTRHYDDKSAFWLNEQGLLVRYRFHQSDAQVWETTLQIR
jgi:hypothetical protein